MVPEISLSSIHFHELICVHVCLWENTHKDTLTHTDTHTHITLFVLYTSKKTLWQANKYAHAHAHRWGHDIQNTRNVAATLWQAASTFLHYTVRPFVRHQIQIIIYNVYVCIFIISIRIICNITTYLNDKKLLVFLHQARYCDLISYHHRAQGDL